MKLSQVYDALESQAEAAKWIEKIKFIKPLVKNAGFINPKVVKDMTKSLEAVIKLSVVGDANCRVLANKYGEYVLDVKTSIFGDKEFDACETRLKKKKLVVAESPASAKQIRIYL